MADSTSGFQCTACLDNFGTAKEQRDHCKTERHLYNTKRKLAGLKPITQEIWEQKLREARAADKAEKTKGTSHLKAKENRKRSGGYNEGNTPSSQVHESQRFVPMPQKPLGACDSLFDNKTFNTPEDCLKYMTEKFGFWIPDREYVTDLEGLLDFLAKKISEPPHACICCDRSFPDLPSVRRHMEDKGHRHVGTEGYSRRGNYNSEVTEALQAQLEPFYDFRSSVKELRLTSSQKIRAILRAFDADRDERLLFAEAAALWAATTQSDLTESQYAAACGKADVDPKEGLDCDALAELYKDGFADLDAHFAAVQAIVLKPKTKKDATQSSSSTNDEIVGAEVDADEGDEDDWEDELESDENEIVECEDENEFEEVMKLYGLKQYEILPNGNLQLPSGAVASHRSLAYVFKQKGLRENAPVGPCKRKSLGDRLQTPLMIAGMSGASGNGAHGGAICKIAVSHRAQNKMGKQMIAVLRRQAKHQMKVGMSRNLIDKKFMMIATDKCS